MWQLSSSAWKRPIGASPGTSGTPPARPLFGAADAATRRLLDVAPPDGLEGSQSNREGLEWYAAC